MEDGVTLDVPSFSSVHFLPYLDLSLLQMLLAWVFATSGVNAHGGGVSRGTRLAAWLPCNTNWWRD